MKDGRKRKKKHEDRTKRRQLVGRRLDRDFRAIYFAVPLYCVWPGITDIPRTAPVQGGTNCGVTSMDDGRGPCCASMDADYVAGLGDLGLGDRNLKPPHSSRRLGFGGLWFGRIFRSFGMITGDQFHLPSLYNSVLPKERNMPTETTTLLSTSSNVHDHAIASVSSVSTILVVIQVVLGIFFVFGTVYSSDEYRVEE